MGAGQSGGLEIGGSSLGYQVLRVYPNSPGSRAGLKAYFDFIVAIGNTRFNKEDGSLREILKASVDQKLKMIVFNTRNKMAREVEIVPTTSWGGSGLLGVSIKHSSFDKADERVWHVVEVDPGSPASQAGFKAGEDYVIGSDSILQENDDLYNLIEAHEGKALKLFVYNVTTDNCREVICHPNSKWGGRGYLGCEFGHGLLHRIPYIDNQAAVGGGDTKPASPTTPLAGLQLQQQTNGSASFRSSAPVQPQQQPANSFAQMPTQPGHQLFQQALFNQTPSRPPQQAPAAREPPVLPQPTPAPKTFAQLASAQFQPQQQSPPPPLPPQQAPQSPLQPNQQQPQQLQPQQQQHSSAFQVESTNPPINSQEESSQPNQAPPQFTDNQSQPAAQVPAQNLNIPPSYQMQQSPQNMSTSLDPASQPGPPPPQVPTDHMVPPQNFAFAQNQLEPQVQQSALGQQYYNYQMNSQQQAPNQAPSYNDPMSAPPQSSQPQAAYQTLPPPPSMYPQGPPLPPPPRPQAQQQSYNYGAAPQQASPDGPYNAMYK